MLETSYYWVLSSYDTVFVTVLFRGSLRGFLLYGFPDENLCLVYLFYLMHLVVLVIISKKNRNQANKI